MKLVVFYRDGKEKTKRKSGRSVARNWAVFSGSGSEKSTPTSRGIFRGMVWLDTGTSDLAVSKC